MNSNIFSPKITTNSALPLAVAAGSGSGSDSDIDFFADIFSGRSVERTSSPSPRVDPVDSKTNASCLQFRMASGLSSEYQAQLEAYKTAFTNSLKLELDSLALKGIEFTLTNEKSEATQHTLNNQGPSPAKMTYLISVTIDDTAQGNKEVGLFKFTVSILNKEGNPPLRISYFAEVNIEDNYQRKGICLKIIKAYHAFLAHEKIDLDYLHVCSSKSFTAKMYHNRGYVYFSEESKNTLTESEKTTDEFLDNSSDAQSLSPSIEMYRILNPTLEQQYAELSSFKKLEEAFFNKSLTELSISA